MLKSELINLNPCYHADYGVTDSDVEKVNDLIDLIQSKRYSTEFGIVPCDGDVVICKGSKTYNNGHLELNGSIGQCYENGAVVCTQPMTPFIHKNRDGSLGVSSASGGYWSGVDLDKLVFKGVRVKRFVDWGHAGPNAGGAITFEAIVNVWEFVDSKFY